MILCDLILSSQFWEWAAAAVLWTQNGQNIKQCICGTFENPNCGFKIFPSVGLTENENKYKTNDKYYIIMCITFIITPWIHIYKIGPILSKPPYSATRICEVFWGGDFNRLIQLQIIIIILVIISDKYRLVKLCLLFNG